MPRVPAGKLILDIQDYESKFRAIAKALDRPQDKIALDLKSGLAERLMDTIYPPARQPSPRPPQRAAPPASAATAAAAPPGGSGKQPASKAPLIPKKGAALPVAKAAQAPQPSQSTSTSSSSSSPSSSSSSSSSDEDEAGPSAPAPAPAAASASALPAGAAHSPFNVWIRNNPEWPQESGLYPMYVKAGPLRNQYFTLATAFVKNVLTNAEHGPITFVDAANPSKTWEGIYNIKKLECRVPGNVSS